jgi:hypothetical protein
MKKFTALVALALLAIAGTGYAVTCAQDNVPAATLLVPYFRVGSAGIVGTGTGMSDIPETSGTDTLVAVTNVSAANIIIHVTVWNKYSAAVLDFNVPMTGWDVVFWSMRDILNGKLNVNKDFYQKLGASGLVGATTDPCGQVYTNSVQTGFVKTTFTRFLIGALDTDRTQAISVYKTPAFGTLFRQNVWTSLDESGDIKNWLDVGAAGDGVIDNSNYSCDGVAGAGVAGEFSGYVTIDVANYCTQHFPNETAYWVNDAIATVGWGVYPGPNVLMGDVFYKDQSPSTTTDNMGNISGDPAVHIEFDSRLLWGTSAATGDATFYGRYFTNTDTYNFGPNAAYSFPGDGRERLGSHYGFRYMQTSPPLVPGPSQYKTWINVWHSDTYTPANTQTDLCGWWAGAAGYDGFMDIPTHQLIIHIWDNDENPIITSGGPSGGPTGGQLYIFLETQRLVVSPNGQVVPPTFAGGWIDLTLPGNFQNQAYIGVEHSGLGTNLSVGHSATLLDGQFICSPKPLINWTAPFPANTIPSGTAVQTN